MFHGSSHDREHFPSHNIAESMDLVKLSSFVVSNVNN